MPDPDRQAEYDKNHARALDKRDKYYRMGKYAGGVEVKDITPKTEAGRLYMEKMAERNRPTSQLDQILARLDINTQPEVRPYLLPYDTARAVVNRIMELDLARKGKTPWFTPDQEHVLDNVIRYFIGDPSSEYPLHKGLLIYGGYGVGKTYLLRWMRTLCNIVPLQNMMFDEVKTKVLVTDIVNAKSLTPLKKYGTGNLFLDDLGEEDKEIHLYKDPKQPMDLLLDERDSIHDRFGYLTHASTNLGAGDDPDALSIDLDRKYGSRIFDRMLEMFTLVGLLGDSKRG